MWSHFIKIFCVIHTSYHTDALLVGFLLYSLHVENTNTKKNSF